MPDPVRRHEHRALVVTTRTAAAGGNGASLRVADVLAVLGRAGYEAEVVTDPERATGQHCLGVLVSYVSARHARAVGRRTGRVWLDVVDSWALVDGSGIAAGHPSYAARALRDVAVLTAAPSPDLVTWISGADRALDRWTVRGRLRLVLPAGGAAAHTALPSSGGPRAVLAGDWAYAANADGLRWFTRRVLPLLERELPEATWSAHVYGPSAPPLPARLSVHGHVADESTLYRQGDVHLAPLRHGGGVKRKVLSPLLAGLPVVSTPSGAHGLQPHPLLDVARTPRRFAAATAARLRAAPHGEAPRLPSLVDADDTGELLAWLAECPASRHG